MKNFVVHVFAVLVLAAMLAACEYDPPPEVEWFSPALGDFTTDTGTDLVVRFSEPVEPDSLAVTLYRRTLEAMGAEEDLLPRCTPDLTSGCIEPVAGPCFTTGDCPGGTCTLDDEGAEATLDPLLDLRVGDYLLRISAGLRDLQGNRTGVPYDISFSVKLTDEGGQTTFEPGVFITWMNLDEPLVFPLEMYWHIRVEPDTGHISGGACDGDLIDPNGDKIRDHNVWKPVPYLQVGDETGFKFVFEGLVQDADVSDDQGDPIDGYFFQTEPFYIYNLQPQVELMDGMIAASIYRDEALDRQVMVGTLTATETYVFDTPAHANRKITNGVLWGYRLHQDEVRTEKAWIDCADPDPETVTRP